MDTPGDRSGSEPVLLAEDLRVTPRVPRLGSLQATLRLQIGFSPVFGGTSEAGRDPDWNLEVPLHVGNLSREARATRLWAHTRLPGTMDTGFPWLDTPQP